MKRKKKRSHTSRRGSGGIWVGGVLPAPVHISGEGTPYRPNMILWLELPEDVITFMDLEDPESSDGSNISFGESLEAAMKSPLVGPPRKPDRIRVADQALADAVQSVLPEVSVMVAPTPELQRILDTMAKDMSSESDMESSYFEDGRIAEESVEALFQAAETFYRCAPWKQVADNQLVRVDIPEMDLRGACLSMIGHSGKDKGFLLFESLADYDTFLDRAEDPEIRKPGVRLLTLEFSRSADLPPSMAKEAMRHGWPVASLESYPRIYSIDPDAMIRPLTERECSIAAMICKSLTAFVLKHESLFTTEDIEPACESFFNEEDMEVRLTMPAWEAHLFKANSDDDDDDDEDDHDDDEVLDVSDDGDPAAMHELDNQLMKRILIFSGQYADRTWMKALPGTAPGDQNDLPLIAKWAMFTLPAKGGTFAERFVEDREDPLPMIARDWLAAQGRSYLSIWEVREVEAGKCMKLRDLLTGEERKVLETSATKILGVNKAILARIVDWQDFSLMCGCHVNPLFPRATDDIVQAIRKKLRRKNNIKPETLRNEKIGRYMIECWSEAVEDDQMISNALPRMQNTGGDELIFTVDYFDFAAKDRNKIGRALDNIPVVLPPRKDDPEQSRIILSRPVDEESGGGATVMGRIVLEGDRIKLETNSVRRADDLRRMLESSLGKMIRYRIRQHKDPMSFLGEGKGGGRS